jgi:hypothetical protein
MKSWKQTFVAVCACLLLASCGGSDSLSNLIPLFNGETYLYFNGRGKIVIKPAVNVVETSMFYEDLALVAIQTDNERRYGFMNGKGKLTIPAKYLRATVFREGLAWVVEPGKAPTAIDKSGEVVFSMPDAEEVSYFSEGLAAFGRKNPEGKMQYGYVDKTGNVAIEPVYRAIFHFSNGVAPVILNEKMGYINRKGEMEIAEQFAVALPFSVSGYARVMSSENHWGVIDRKGAYVLNPKYEGIVIDGADFLVQENGKFGLMDKSGKFIVPPDFKMLMPFSGEPFTVASLDGKKYGIIDRKGKFTVNPQFDFGASFIRGAVVVVSGNQFGIVDTKGKYVVNPGYEKSCEDLVYSRHNESNYETVATDCFDRNTAVNQARGNTSQSAAPATTGSTAGSASGSSSESSDFIGKTTEDIESMGMRNGFAGGIGGNCNNCGVWSFWDEKKKKSHLFLVEYTSHEILDELIYDANTTDIIAYEPVRDKETGGRESYPLRYKMVNGKAVLVAIYECKDNRIVAKQPGKNLELDFDEP